MAGRHRAERFDARQRSLLDAARPRGATYLHCGAIRAPLSGRLGLLPLLRRSIPARSDRFVPRPRELIVISRSSADARLPGALFVRPAARGAPLGARPITGDD